MNFNLPSFQVKLANYSDVISLGNTNTAKYLINQLGLSTNVYPFDDITTQPHLLIKYLHENASFYPSDNDTMTNTMTNDDKVSFSHVDLSTDEKRQAFEVDVTDRFDKLASILSSGSKTLFLYICEADLYNEHDSLVNKTINYINIKNLAVYLKQLYPKSSFDILCVHVNDERLHETLKVDDNDTNIFNFTVYIENTYISLNQETKKPEVIEPFRKLVEAYLKCIFYGSDKVVEELKKSEENNEQNLDISNTSNL